MFTQNAVSPMFGELKKGVCLGGMCKHNRHNSDARWAKFSLASAWIVVFCLFFVICFFETGFSV